MPRDSQGPHLWKRKARRKNGRIVATSVWIIKHNGKHISTGCVGSPAQTGPPAEALKVLAQYISEQYQPVREQRSITQIDVADVLSIYYQDTYERRISPKQFASRVQRLNAFFGGKTLAEINRKLCKEYERSRGNSGGARRDLEDLRAAINHHACDNLHDAMIHVTLPEKGPSRDRYLNRSEAARFIWACLRHHETQTVHRGRFKGQKIKTKKRPLLHIARFALIGLYTGTRASAIASASPYRATGRSYVDLDQGVFFRLAQGKRGTKKRQPPVPIPARLLDHMRRWKRKGIINSHFVEWNGAGIHSVKNGFKTAVREAKLSMLEGNITPHTLRHTAATWLMQRGTDIWQASGFLGMSPQVLIDVYGHHHPDYMQDAAKRITKNDRNQNVSVVKSVVDLNLRREISKKTQ
jgi:integrase